MNANGPVERDGGMLLSHVLIGPEYRQEFGKVNGGDRMDRLQNRAGGLIR